MKNQKSMVTTETTKKPKAGGVRKPVTSTVKLCYSAPAFNIILPISILFLVSISVFIVFFYVGSRENPSLKHDFDLPLIYAIPGFN